MEEYHMPEAKSITFNLNRFVVDEEKEHEFAYWVGETAKLIGRSYMQTFKLIEKWPLELIIRRYELATKHNGSLSPAVKWWYERKRGKTEE